MTLLTTLHMALSSLGLNKLRSGLTLVGIVIGVTAITSLMAIGKGTEQAIIDSIQSLGSNLVLVQPGATIHEGVVGELGSADTLSLNDAYALIDPVLAPSVVSVAPEVITSGQIVAGRENAAAQIFGVTPEYQFVRNYTLGSGQFITPEQVQDSSQVTVLGSKLAEDLFGFQDPVGQRVQINSRNFTIIGVLESKGGGLLGTQDNLALVPITTAHHRLASQRPAHGTVNVQGIGVQVRSADSMDQAVREIATVLRLRHRIIGEDDFTISNQQETIEAFQKAIRAFTIFLAAVSGISLLISGIGIMNIMLVSVTERTREIGIRKAIGARRSDIQLQFVSEAVLLSLCGGATGVVLGFVISSLLNGLSLGDSQTLHTVFSGKIALLAMGVSAAIGLFFGIYPAVRASRLHPIEALRRD